MDKELLANDDFAALAKKLADDFGTQVDDKEDKNEKLDDFIEELGDVNFYTLTTLLVLDPTQAFKTLRSNFKMFLLPTFQILVPLGMIWYFLVQEGLFAKQGYCCNNENTIFRFVGFVTFMYSGWQIIDGCDDASSKFLLKASVKQWSLTGRAFDFKAACMFYLGYVSQQLCSMLLLIVTYVIYTSECDTPLDLLMNCVAINFVLDIDTEWVSDAQQGQAQTSAKWLYKEWRDSCKSHGAEVKRSMKHFQSIRKSAITIVKNVCHAGDVVIWVTTYALVFGWTFCPASY